MRGFLCWTFGVAVLYHLFMSQIGRALRGGVKGARPGCVHGLTSNSQDTEGSWPFSGYECMQDLHMHMHRHSYAARTTAEMSVRTTMEQGWAVGVCRTWTWTCGWRWRRARMGR